jgi:hypothetical protein
MCGVHRLQPIGTKSAGEDYLGVVNAYFGQNSSSTIDFPHKNGAGP